MKENILVFSAKTLEDIGYFSGLCCETKKYLPILLHPNNLLYMPRCAAEFNPKFKQVIPYIVLLYNNMVFQYKRGNAGGESRLHNLYSLGIGGHINETDGDERVSFNIGFQRELREEVEIQSKYESKIVGMIHDDVTEVGRVHFGIVFSFLLEQPKVKTIDPALCEGKFVPIKDVVYSSLERWSQLIYKHLP